MDGSTASWLVIALALAAANLPFLNDRVFAVFPLKRRKLLVLRLAEMLLLYLVVGTIGRSLEAAIGTNFPQSWEFFAITGCLFIVLAFPGFVLRYLRKRHG